MATFFRGLSLARAGPSRIATPAPFIRAFTAPSLPLFEADSNSSSAPAPSSSSSSAYPTNPYGLQSSKPVPLSSAFSLPDSGVSSPYARPRNEASTDPDAWWAAQVRTLSSSYSGGLSARGNLPGTPHSGRSILVRSNDVGVAIRRLSGLLSRTGVKKDVRRMEYREKPSDKRRRLEMERHRRRFQEMVREKVQTVQMIRNRG